MHLRTLTCCTSLFIAPFLTLSAQERTGTGYTMEWTHDPGERSDVLSVGKHELRGLSFMAYECSTSEAMGYWKDHMEKLDGKVKGSDPVRVTQGNVPGLGTSVPVIYADARADQRVQEKEKQGASTELEALKRKLEAIH